MQARPTPPLPLAGFAFLASTLLVAASCADSASNGRGGSGGGASASGGSGGTSAGGSGGAAGAGGSGGAAGMPGGGTSAGGSGGGAGDSAGGSKTGGAGGGSAGGSKTGGAGGAGGAAGSGGGLGGAGGTGGGAGGTTTPTGPTTWINSKGVVPVNTLGMKGDWYAFGDGTTTTQSGNPYRDGKYCVKGTAPGDGDSSKHWGAGIGVDLNASGSTKSPYEYEGKVTGFKILLTGTVPTTPRVQFVNHTDDGVSPFILATMDEATTYAIAEAKVPFDWDVPNAGQGVEGGVLYSLQVLVDGAATAGEIDLCIAEIEPVYDPGAGGTGGQGGTYVNSDGYIQAASNPFGIQGPVYAISDGKSTTQTGNPFADGKYCVKGTFTGAKDDWGAGIAFDLNKAPGGSRSPYAWKNKVGGFRIKLSGESPGRTRIQLVVTEPPDGNQPFVMGLLNTTTVYRIKWAQIPTSWDTADQGKEVGDDLYTVQVYLEGDKAGDFDVCVEDFTPLADDQLATDAQTAGAGYSGARTVSAAILAQEYKYWKANRLKDCGDGTACVPTDENNCISEGIGYGMLIAVGYDDRATFDKLWAYYKKHKMSQGVMTWKTTACGSPNATGSATDGDLDAAMALLQAGCKWGGTYKSDGTSLISAIKNNATTTCDGKLVLQPGAGFGGCNETNPSYFAVGYYKAFAQVTGDASWTTLASDSYSLLATLQGKLGGAVPDWCDAGGNAQSGDRGQYGPDASRTPWRVATDYAWNNEQKAVTFLASFMKYVDGKGGVARAFTPNSNFRGGSGLAGLPLASAKAQEHTDAWLQTAADDTTYFPGTLRLVYMLLAAHKFPEGCN